MKFLLFLTLIPSMVNAAERINIPTNEVYTPKGFDANDNAEVIVTGVLPNLCYQNPKYDLDIQGKDIFIDVSATYIDTFVCAEVAVPYLKVIDLGVLPAGDYNVFVNKNDATPLQESIKIVPKNRGRIDQFRYPVVADVKYDKAANKIAISGYKPSDCFQFDGVEVYTDNDKIVTILPKMRQIRDFCPRKMTPVSEEVTLPDLKPNSKHLIHVRSLNQESKNLEVVL